MNRFGKTPSPGEWNSSHGWPLGLLVIRCDPALNCVIQVTDWLEGQHTWFPRPTLAADRKEAAKSNRGDSPAGLEFESPAPGAFNGEMLFLVYYNDPAWGTV